MIVTFCISKEKMLYTGLFVIVLLCVFLHRFFYSGVQFNLNNIVIIIVEAVDIVEKHDDSFVKRAGVCG